MVDGQLPGTVTHRFGAAAAVVERRLTPYLDPLELIPRDHVEEAAEEAGIAPEDIDAQVASLSAHFGWDITRGAKAS
jgi:hypothetical protein